jgi:hypothetical protein
MFVVCRFQFGLLGRNNAFFAARRSGESRNPVTFLSALTLQKRKAFTRCASESLSLLVQRK